MLVAPLALAWTAAALFGPLDGRRRGVGAAAVAALALVTASSGALAAAVLGAGTLDSVSGGWPAGIGIRLRADPLGASFAFASNLLLLAALLYEHLGGIGKRAFPALLLLLAAGLNGLFLTADVFNFYVFFEVAMTTAFVLASYGRSRHEVRDALTFALVNLVGSTVFLSAVAGLYHATGTLDMAEVKAAAAGRQPPSLMLVGALVFVAFGLKLGLFPFHGWLPALYRGARPAVAAVLAGVLANVGSYGLLRFGGDVLLRELDAARGLLLWLGAATVAYGGVVAVSRRAPTEMLAYSSISQAGYVLLGLAAGGAAGLAAAILYALLNALNKTLLFLACGVRGPLVGGAFLVGAVSVAGLPPAAGFLGKAALFRAAAGEGSLLLAVFVVAGAALSFGYVFPAYQRRHWEAPRRAAGRPGQRAVVALLALLVVGLGLWPEALVGVSVRAARLGGVP